MFGAQRDNRTVNKGQGRTGAVPERRVSPSSLLGLTPLNTSLVFWVPHFCTGKWTKIAAAHQKFEGSLAEVSVFTQPKKQGVSVFEAPWLRRFD